jgi:hypothetical protein
MRVVAAAALLAAWAGQAVAESPVPTISPEDAHAGCLHNDLRPCMITLGSKFWFDMHFVAGQIAKRNELDVNGRTAHRKILIRALRPSTTKTITITLTLASPSPNDQVVKAEAILPVDAELAHTPSEYDGTYLYDTVAALLGKGCPNLDRMALYRFYENGLKPREVVKTEVRKVGLFNHTTQTVDTDKVPFCGAMFSLHRQTEWDGPPDYINKPLKSLLTTIEME